jgi:hypothetical protein
MREYFTYGSVRGAAGDGGPYRVRQNRSLESLVALSSRPFSSAMKQIPYKRVDPKKTLESATFTRVSEKRLLDLGVPAHPGPSKEE